MPDNGGRGLRAIWDDVWLLVTHVTELPPIVWVRLAQRMRAAG